MEIILTFENTHQVIMAEDILIKNSISVNVMPVPSLIKAGCGLCLRLIPENINNAKYLLKQKNITVEQYYIRTIENGKSAYRLYGGENFE